jgi:hypothetical protein
MNMDSYKKSKNSLRKHKNIWLRKIFFYLQANIPVQNGIVHLIDKPLVILTSSLWDSIDPANQVTVYATFIQSGSRAAVLPSSI